MKTHVLTEKIKAKALALGFDSVGIARADKLADEETHLKTWLANGYHGKMGYMTNHFDKRLDPRLLEPETQSIIVVTHNYYPEKALPDDNYKIARYAYGEDYHKVLKDKLHLLLQQIKKWVPKANGRVFTDSAPVLERAWATHAGLGWQGKNTLLIQKGKGSYFFIAEILLNLELNYDTPFKADHCGTCTRCIDACPTQAILDGKILDASRCISYLTIELKDEIPKKFQDQWKEWIFGCDICQEVCPWNDFSLPHSDPRFDSSQSLFDLKSKDWEQLTQETFNKIFPKSAVKRTKLKGLKRNIDFTKLM
jgi:epoxyqueuosine reductase